MFKKLRILFVFLFVISITGVALADVRVLRLVKGWAAETAGVQTGDIILSVDGHPVSNPQEFLDNAGALPYGVHILLIERAGVRHSVPVRLPPGLGVVIGTSEPSATAAMASAGAPPLRDASSREALANAIRQVSYSAPQSISQRLAAFNVLRYAFLHPKTGDITLVGNYDPAYPSGPIPYYDLLADAMQNPYPRFSLEYDPDNPSFRRVVQTIDSEMSSVLRDANHGIAWMKRLMTAALDPRSQSEDRLILEQRLRKMGIPPDVFTAYIAWDGESGLHDTKFRQKMGLFLAKILAGVGIDERVGYGIIALKDWARAAVDIKQGRAPVDGEQPVDKTIRLFRYLGIENDLFRLREEMAAGRLMEPRATTEVLASIYSSLLRGLQVPESEVSSLVERYRAGRIPEQAIADRVNARWSELAKRSLLKNVFNWFNFSGAHLSQMYSLPPVMSGVKLFGSQPDSPVMRVFFDADYTLKYVASAATTANSVPGNMNFLEYQSVAADRAGASAGKLPVQGGNRYWLYPGAVEMDEFSDDSGLHFIAANVRVGAEPLEEPKGGDSRGNEFYSRTLNQYGKQLTSQYDAYARMYPSLHVMRETEKVIALARWIKSRRVPARALEVKPARMPMPQRVEGFWGLTYNVRPTGMTDHMYLWIQGGVDFGQEQGDSWMKVTLNVTATSNVLQLLTMSAAQAELAARAALDGDLELARALAEISANTMMQQIAGTVLPSPVALPTSVDLAQAATLSKETLIAVDENLRRIENANVTKQKAFDVEKASPIEATKLREMAETQKRQAEANLKRLIDAMAIARQDATKTTALALQEDSLLELEKRLMEGGKKYDEQIAMRKKGLASKVLPLENRRIHEGVILGFTNDETDANDMMEDGVSCFTGESYAAMNKAAEQARNEGKEIGGAIVVAFGIPEEKDKFRRFEFGRVLADHRLAGKASLVTPQGQKVVKLLAGTMFDRLVAHSNGASVAEALIRENLITVDELNIVGGDTSLLNGHAYQQLLDSGKVKRIVVWTNVNDPVAAITSMDQAKLAERSRDEAIHLVNKITANLAGGDVSVSYRLMWGVDYRNPTALTAPPGLTEKFLPSSDVHRFEASYCPGIAKELGVKYVLPKRVMDQK